MLPAITGLFFVNAQSFQMTVLQQIYTFHFDYNGNIFYIVLDFYVSA